MTRRRKSQSCFFEKPRLRELLVWCLCLVTLIFNRHIQQQQHDGIVSNDESTHGLFMNNKPSGYYEKRRLGALHSTSSYYERAIVHSQSSATGLVSRTWHSNNAPTSFQKGSCWCSANDYCMCTPSLAIDVVLTSGDYIWLVKRRDTGQFALMVSYNIRIYDA